VGAKKNGKTVYSSETVMPEVKADGESFTEAPKS